MRAHRGVEVQLHSFLTWAQGGGEWLSHLRCVSPGKVHWYWLRRVWMGFKSWSGCFGEEKNIFFLPGFEPSTVQPTA